MAKTEAEFTQAINAASEKLVKASMRRAPSYSNPSYYSASDKEALARDAQTFLQGVLGCTPHPTLEDLNRNFRERTGEPFDLIPAGQYSQEEQTKLAEYLRIHIKAMQYGARYMLDAQSNQPRHTVTREYIYVSPYYRRTFADDFFLFYLLSSNHCCYHYGGGGSWGGRGRRGDKDDGKAGLVLLAIVAVASAAISSFYAGIQGFEAIDDIVHGENIGAHLAKLGAVGAAITGGVFAGMLIGASLYAMPIVGAIIGAAILSGISYKVINLIQNACRLGKYDTQAFLGDDRAELSTGQAGRLASNGYDVVVVQEALRALFVDLKNIDSNSMTFWDDKNKMKRSIKETIRDLKSGKIASTHILVGGKIFEIKPSNLAHRTEAVSLSGERLVAAAL